MHVVRCHLARNERKRVLKTLLGGELPKEGLIRLSDHFETDGSLMLKHACEMKLEGIEDSIDRLDERVAGVGKSSSDDRLARIEARLDEITRDIAALATLPAPGGEPMPRAR